MTIDEQKIHNICKKHNIKNYTINPDRSIDVDGDVLLYNMGLKKLPLDFNIVSGYFNCSWEKLTSLKGCPKEVGDDFYCSYNKLKTLEHSPLIIYGTFYCNDNPLESLEGLNIPISKLHCNNKEKLIRKTKLKILESL